MIDIRPLGPIPTKWEMHTVDQRVVHSQPHVMFQLAADVDRWPERLNHYRAVQFLQRDGSGGGLVVMSANRPFGAVNWPVFWVARMTVDATHSRIRYHHVQGVTTGMDVEWTFDEIAEGTHVRIVHVWNGPSWPFGALIAQWCIGPVFVHGIAERTLAGLAAIAER